MIVTQFGVKAMQPVIVAMVVACFLLWIPIPKKSEDSKTKPEGEKDVVEEHVQRDV